MLRWAPTWLVVMGATWGVVLLADAHAPWNYVLAGIAALFQGELGVRIDDARRWRNPIVTRPGESLIENVERARQGMRGRRP